MQRPICCLLFLAFALPVLSQDRVSDQDNGDDFPIVTGTMGATPIYYDPKDYWLVGKAVRLLQEDIHRVTGQTPVLLTDLPEAIKIPNLIIVGSFDQSSLIRRLTSLHILPSGLQGKWESFMLKPVQQPV